MEKYIKISDKIKIRKANIKDLDFIIKTENKPENKENVFQWSKEVHSAEMKNDDILYTIIEDMIGDEIGYAIIAGLKDKNNTIELRRVVINQKNMGYGTDFLQLIKEYTFKDLSYHKLWLDFFITNKKVESLYKRNGFKKEGILRDKYRYNDGYISMVVMSILEDEYFDN